jgi:hypothetical protein
MDVKRVREGTEIVKLHLVDDGGIDHSVHLWH